MDKISSHDEIIPQLSHNVNVVLGPNQQLHIIDSTYTKKPSYIMVASGYTARNDSMNYTDELLAMTAQEGFLFQLLMENREIPDLSKSYIRSNYSFIDSSKLSKTDKNRLSEGYKRLRKKDIVIRVKRGSYLINPNFVMTNDDLWSRELATYIDLVAKLKPIKSKSVKDPTRKSLGQIIKEKHERKTVTGMSIVKFKETKMKITKEYMSSRCATGYEFYECAFSEVEELLGSNAAYSNFRFKDGVRGKDNIINGTSFVVLDIDQSVIEDKDVHLMLNDTNHFIARTSNKDNPFKFRVLIQFDTVVDLDDRTWRQFVAEVGTFVGVSPDPLPKSQIYFSYAGRDILSTLDGEPLATREHIMRAAEKVNKPTATKKISVKEQKSMLDDPLTTFERAYTCIDGSGSRELYTAVLYAKDLGCDLEYATKLLDAISTYWTEPFPTDRLEKMKEQIERLF